MKAWGAAVRDGQTFGVPVDCNPMVLWYNKKVLKEAGITEMPADLQANGQWTWDKFKEMSDKIRDSKSTATCWITPGTAITAGLLPTAAEYTTTKGTCSGFGSEGDGGVPLPVRQREIQNITFSGTLPKGQGGDAMFMSNQVGFVAAGRWYLPLFKKNQGLEYDVVTWPTNTGNKIEPAGIPTAYMVMNKASKNKEAAYTFFRVRKQRGSTFPPAGRRQCCPVGTGNG